MHEISLISGMVPDNLLWDKSMYPRFLKAPTSDVIVPVKALLDRSSAMAMEESLVISEGIEPLRLLYERPTITSWYSCQYFEVYSQKDCLILSRACSTKSSCQLKMVSHLSVYFQRD